MKIGNRFFDTKNHTYIMGILNVTPDSFSDGGKWNHIDEALKHTEAMIADGADIIDIGGESTRPGHTPVSADEEAQNVILQVAGDIGLAFQIQDDILDITSSLEVLGKQTGSDLKNHKVTYVSLNGMEHSVKEVRRLSEEAISGLSSIACEKGGAGRNEFLEVLVDDLITRKK